VIEQFETSEAEETIREPALVQTMETILERMQSPAQRLERTLTPWTTYLILPIFALANAGVPLSVGASRELLSPVSLGVILGLVIGKPLGISLFSWIALRTGLAEMSGDLHFKQLVGASFLAGIGFTLSLFIANAAFADSDLLASVKLSILVASILAGVIGILAFRLVSRVPSETTQLEPASAIE
jgi:NhaA family Na+:H+ antiporter